MKEIFAKRLKAARLLAGLSQDKLVDAIGHMVSKNAIAKYERAEMMPNSQVLIALAKALSVKPDYFFRPFTVEIGQVEFRKKSKLGARKLKVLQQQVSDQIERYLEIESLLDISSKFDNPIGHLLISKGEDVEKAVNTLLESWKMGINALPNVIELLEDKEIKVIEIEADPAFDGLSGWANGEIPVIVLNRGYPIERKRFTALHELGHLLMHVKKNLSPKEMEKLCHRFAGAMLMPKETFLSPN
jgi:transcriptional regulator with XRE-family HTH domain